MPGASRIEIRGPMPGASRIEMPTQTCTTPADISCFMYCKPMSTWGQPIHHPLYHTTLSVHLSQPNHPLGPLCVVVTIKANHGHCSSKASSSNQHYVGDN